MTESARIRILSEETVNRVAAGEVVERPAAALKELLENAVDAGAKNLRVELARAGLSLISVADDGCGMAHNEVLLALERHATSKIASVEDLARVATFGFRGEALPSIAAVSLLRIETRERGAAAGTLLEVEGGRVVRVGPCGCPDGTRVEVRELFHSVPARRKFMRSEATELGHCLQVASRLALACPGIGISLLHGGRELLRAAPAPDTASRLRGLVDRDFFAGLVPVRAARGALAVDGFVSRPGAGRPGAEYQQLFVNGRPVRDPVLARGVREACRDHFRQEAGGVSYYLWITLPAEAVDVNVHPTKREVRFRDLAAVLALIGPALREALRADRAGAMPPPTPRPSPLAPPASSADLATPLPALAADAPRDAGYAAAGPPQPQLAFAAPLAPQTVPDAVPLQLFGTYLVRPGPDGLVLVDQHAAHERVLYERLLARPVASAQQLLEPTLLECSPSEHEVLEGLAPTLAAVGVAIEPFGPRAWRVNALPSELSAPEAAAFVRELAALALEAGSNPPLEEFRHRAMAVLACHAAVRAKQRLGAAQVASLLADLARCANPGSCPHGRPTSITIDRAEIERRFKRT